MLQEEAGFVSKHNVVAFRCPRQPFIALWAAQTPMGFSHLYTKQWMPCGHSPLIEMVQNGISRHPMMSKRQNLLSYGLLCAHNAPVIT
ncbi:hypothetical protein TNCV_2398771 [Trichonephila clavipes]|uniref:Uncharacterized protein n=1 Tax=Trichonephila clavipes TaxID=2585209 RepID=A0A8X6VHC2_TRICX|nr:hypothetical protein TNCV_2398771 [Trichonephila clavipes]